MKKLITMLSFALFALGVTAAQSMVAGNDFDHSQVQPIGNAESSFEAYEDSEDRGAIVLTHTTPEDQHANFDVVGPDGTWEHFDFSDDEGDEHRLTDLTPGVYSIAASDEGLGLVHTLVEVRRGEATRVNFDLTAWEPAAEGEFDAAKTYGSYEGFGEDVQAGYPYGAYGVGAYESHDDADFGALSVSGLEDDTELVVTGPNDFSTSVSGDDEITRLAPGLYVLAATGEGMDVSVTTVEVRAGQRLPVDPDFVQRSAGESGEQEAGAEEGDAEEAEDEQADD